MHATSDHTDTNAPPGAGSDAARAKTAWRGARSQICIVLTLGTCVIALLWTIMIVVIHTERRAAIEHAGNEANNLSAAFQAEITQTLNTVARSMRTVAELMRAVPGNFDIDAWARANPLLVGTTIQGAIIRPDG